MRLTGFLLLFSLLTLPEVYGQKIDNTSSIRSLPTSSYFRFSYDNDYFSATDYYYTQGYSFELAHPSLRKNPLARLLVRLNDSSAINGIALEHIGFTPTSIRHEEILVGDRPFAAVIGLKSFLISINREKKLRLASVLSTGVIGPAAFGGEMQKTIHGWIGGVDPKGWNHQLKNDIVLNYQLALEKSLIEQKLFSLNAGTKLNAGTLHDNIEVSSILKAGIFEADYELSSKAKRLFQAYIYFEPVVGLVAYDGTLQGGMLNRSSEYTIASSELSRMTFQQNLGLIVKIRGLYLEYSRSFITKEFQMGRRHSWGGIKLGFGI